MRIGVLPFPLGATFFGADHPGGDDFTYAYDPAGNITELTGPSGSSTRTYSDGDRLLTESSTGSHSDRLTTDTATGDWTDAGNLSTSDDIHATASPEAQTTLSLEAAFDFSAIPNDAAIDEVTVSVEWRSSLATAELTLGAQALLDGTPVGTETTETTNPSTDTTASFVVADVDRAELDTLTVAVRASRAGGDPVIASLDVVSVEVTYTLPLREFTYDANGSLLDDGAGTTYAHDALARLTTITSAEVTAAYILDGAGNRVAATIDGVTTAFDLDLRGLATVLSDGSRRFLPGVPAAGYEEAGVWLGGLTNAQGTVLGHLDAGGLVGGLAQYDAWGQLLGAAPVAEGPGYSGEWTDATGLVNLRFRAYDPTQQRLIGRDSFAGAATAPAAWNRFAYANANPLTYTDPSGHFGVAARSTNGARIVNHLFGSAGDLFMALTGRDWADGRNVSWGERGEKMASVIPTTRIGKGATGSFKEAGVSSADAPRGGARVLGPAVRRHAAEEEGLLDHLWHAARFVGNAGATALGVAASRLTGSDSCEFKDGLIVECYGNDFLAEGNAITIGNAVTTQQSETDYYLTEGLHEHERGHTNQWLIPGFPLLYGVGAVWSWATREDRDWFCGNPFEHAAGPTEVYERCGWDP